MRTTRYCAAASGTGPCWLSVLSRAGRAGRQHPHAHRRAGPVVGARVEARVVRARARGAEPSDHPPGPRPRTGPHRALLRRTHVGGRCGAGEPPLGPLLDAQRALDSEGLALTHLQDRLASCECTHTGRGLHTPLTIVQSRTKPVHTETALSCVSIGQQTSMSLYYLYAY